MLDQATGKGQAVFKTVLTFKLSTPQAPPAGLGSVEVDVEWRPKFLAPKETTT